MHLKRKSMSGVLRPTVALWLLFLTADVCAASDPPTRIEEVEFDRKSADWVETVPPEPGTPQGDLTLARRLHEGGEQGKALRAVDRWIENYGELNDLYPKAALLRCAIQIANRDYHDAHLALQQFLGSYAGTGYVDEALTMEFAIAEVFLSGTRRKIWGMRVLKADDVGVAILDDIQTNYANTRFGELAIMAKADFYYRTSDFVFAEQEYIGLTQQYPESRYFREALLGSARAALASFPGVRFDDAPLIEAEERFRQYITRYPGSAEQEGIGLILTEIAETRAAKEFDVGQYYEKTEHTDAAVFYYRSTLTHWPDTLAAVQATNRLQALGALETQEPQGPIAESELQ